MTDEDLGKLAELILKNQWSCFLCRWILEDIRLHGKLTDWPYDFNDKSEFPKKSKQAHIALEVLI